MYAPTPYGCAEACCGWGPGALRAGPGPAGCGSTESRCLLSARAPSGSHLPDRPERSLAAARALSLAASGGAPVRHTVPDPAAPRRVRGRSPGGASGGGLRRTYRPPAIGCQQRLDLRIFRQCPGQRGGDTARMSTGGRVIFPVPYRDITRSGAGGRSGRPRPCAGTPGDRCRGSGPAVRACRSGGRWTSGRPGRRGPGRPVPPYARPRSRRVRPGPGRPRRHGRSRASHPACGP